MRRQVVVLEALLLLGILLIGVGFGMRDPSLACIIVGALLLALVMNRMWIGAKRRS